MRAPFVGDRLGGDGAARERGQLPLEGRGHARDQGRGVGDEQRARHRIVLGLGQQVGRQPLGIGAASAMTTTSLGPATMSMPTSPNTLRLASAT